MKTDELVSLLAAQVEPVPPHAAARRVTLALLLGASLAFAFLLLEYGVRADLSQAATAPMFWTKLALPLCLAAAGWLLTERLARPGVATGHATWAVALPLLAVWAMSLLLLWRAPPEARMAMVIGRTWRSCAFSIAAMALPVFVAALIALRSLAPTRPAAAGAAAGLLAGGVGASVYALHCPEYELPFLALWYVLGMALPVLAGAVLGPRVLRW